MPSSPPTAVPPLLQDPHPEIHDASLQPVVEALATFNPGPLAITQNDARLYLACIQGDCESVLWLLALGARADLDLDVAGRLTHVALLPPQGNHADPKTRARIVRMLLGYGAPIDEQNSEGRTALAVAAWSDNKHAVRVLTEREPGAKLDVQDRNGDTALHHAVSQYQSHMASLLITKGANVHLPNHDGRTPLGSLLTPGVMPGRNMAVERLMCAGAALPAAWVGSVLQAGLKGELTVLFARTGHVSDVEALMAPDVPSAVTMELTRELLEQAVHAGQLPVVKFLVESKGAAVHEVDSSGFSILSHAAASGRAEILEYLFQRDPGLVKLVNQVPRVGEEPNSPLHEDPLYEEPYAPLHFAAEGGHVEAAKVLIANGADPNLYSGDGLTALHIAAVAGNAPLVQLLLGSGANAGLPRQHADFPDQTAADLARENGHGILANLLNRH